MDILGVAYSSREDELEETLLSRNNHTCAGGARLVFACVSNFPFFLKHQAKKKKTNVAV